MDDYTALARATFLPYYDDKRKRFLDGGKRFIYYTTAQTAEQILEGKKLWMRSTGVMNDYSEVLHGIKCLNSSLESMPGSKLKEALEGCFPRVFEQIIQQYRDWLPLIYADTFIACFSEHHPVQEPLGRLSMWRAYGGENGVGLVLKPESFFAQTTNIGAYTSPVAYLDEQGVADEILKIAGRISRNADFVRSMGELNVVSSVVGALKFAAICTKHPAFIEEQEWRVVTSSTSAQTSPFLSAEIRSVGGVPQVVLELDLAQPIGEGLPSLHPKDFVEGVLIGPCLYPDTVHRALGKRLQMLGHPAPFECIRTTRIPLRPNLR